MIRIAIFLFLAAAGLLVLSAGTRRVWSTYQADTLLAAGTFFLFWGVILGIIGLVRML